jgi:hypothetical protein
VSLYCPLSSRTHALLALQLRQTIIQCGHILSQFFNHTFLPLPINALQTRCQKMDALQSCLRFMPKGVESKASTEAVAEMAKPGSHQLTDLVRKHVLASLYPKHTKQPRSVRPRREKTSWQAPSVVLTSKSCMLLQEQFDITRYPPDDPKRGGKCVFEVEQDRCPYCWHRISKHDSIAWRAAEGKAEDGKVEHRLLPVPLAFVLLDTPTSSVPYEPVKQPSYAVIRAGKLQATNQSASDWCTVLSPATSSKPPAGSKVKCD